MRLDSEGQPLPNARKVSTTMFGQKSVLSKRLNQLYVSFGQFIAHDLAKTPQKEGNIDR